MNEVEYPPYSVSDNQVVAEVFAALNLSDSKSVIDSEANKIGVELYYMLDREVNALKSLKALLVSENQS